MTTSMFLTPDKTGYIPIVYQTKDGKEITLTIDDIKRFLIRGNPEKATIQELVFFAGVCRARGMDPYAGDCYLIKYSDDPAAIVTARSYFESRAKAQRDCQGWKAGIVVITDEGEGEEVYRTGALPRPGDVLIGGWFKGDSSKWEYPLEIEVSLPMYIKKTKQGHITKFWAPEKQAHMIRKVALVQGLRELWPNEFASLYAPEEMGPETAEPAAITLEASEVTEVTDPVADLQADLKKKVEEDAKAKAETKETEAEAAEQKKAEEEAAAIKQREAEEQAEAEKQDEETIRRRALVRTFDAKTDAAKLSSKDVNDYLFKTLEKLQDGTTIEDLKVKAVEQRLLDGLVIDMVKVSKPELVTVATLGTDAAEIIKAFKMQKKQGFFGDKGFPVYEAEKHLWPIEAQVEYANKCKDMQKAWPDEMQAALAEVYGAGGDIDEDGEATKPTIPDPGEATKQCDKCGEPATGELCEKCAQDEEGEGGEDKSAFYQFLERMQDLKKKLVEAFGQKEGVGKYYAVLGSHGFEKSNEITDRAVQITVYKEIGDLLK